MSISNVCNTSFISIAVLTSFGKLIINGILGAMVPPCFKLVRFINVHNHIIFHADVNNFFVGLRYRSIFKIKINIYFSLATTATLL